MNRRIRPSLPRIVAWGIFAGLMAVTFALFIANRRQQEVPLPGVTEARTVKVAVTPVLIRTGITSTVQVAAQDGEGNRLAVWEGADASAWLVRNDLTYAAHVPAQAGTSTLSVPLRPTQPGTYRLAVAGVQGNDVTLGGVTLGVGGRGEDLPPEEQSAGRGGYKLALSTIPDASEIRAGDPVAMTFAVSRTGAPVPLGEKADARGELVAFRENGTIFVRGEPHPPAYLPSPSATAFTLTFPEPGRYRVFFAFEAAGVPLMEARWIEVRPAR